MFAEDKSEIVLKKGILMATAALEERLGVKFNDATLLEQALTHRSYVNEHRSYPLEHNERLEFLGDAVLELISSDFLFRSYPRHQEGGLTELRSRLVRNEVLTEVADRLGIWDSMRLGKGSLCVGKRTRDRLTACAIEAIIGALFLDQGLDAARSFVTKHVLRNVHGSVPERDDPKSELQEKAQSIERVTPRYQLLQESGLEHTKTFVVGVFLGSTMVAQGSGPAKKKAEVEAARAALKAKGW